MTEKNSNTLVLSEGEFLALLTSSGNQRLHSLAKEYQLSSSISEKELEEGRIQLVRRGLFNSEGKIARDYEKVLSPLFSPEKIILLVKDSISCSRQVVTILRQGGSALMYAYLPTEGNYYIELINSVKQVDELFLTWFSFSEATSVPDYLIISSSSLEEIRLLAQQGDLNEATKTLQEAGWKQEEAEQFSRAVQEPHTSGSMALFELSGEDVTDIFSLAFLSDGQTVWYILEPSPEAGLSLIDGDKNSFTRILEQVILRFFSDEDIDQPIPQDVIISFSLTVEELAYCLATINDPVDAYHLMKKFYPNTSEEILQKFMLRGGLSLLARGWCKPSASGFLLLKLRLESAVFPLAHFDYMIQAKITRPEMQASAVINVVQHQTFTALLQPDEKTYVLEHSNTSALSAYIAMLFLDFGEGTTDIRKEKIHIRYDLLSSALEMEDKEQLEDLEKAGFNAQQASRFASDYKSSLYRGSIIRINTSSYGNKEMDSMSKRPTLLLLRSQKNSWLLELASEDDNQGIAAIVDRSDFLRVLKHFLK